MESLLKLGISSGFLTTWHSDTSLRANWTSSWLSSPSSTLTWSPWRLSPLRSSRTTSPSPTRWRRTKPMSCLCLGHFLRPSIQPGLFFFWHSFSITEYFLQVLLPLLQSFPSGIVSQLSSDWTCEILTSILDLFWWLWSIFNFYLSVDVECLG